MPRGSSPKREREYAELKQDFKREHRYRGREDEVAARIVNKQRRDFGETKDAPRSRTGGRSARELPVANYDRLTVSDVKSRLERLEPREVRAIRAYERAHKNRSSLVDAIDSWLRASK